MTIWLRWLVPLGLVVLTCRRVCADTLVVDLDGTAGFTDIQLAIDAAKAGDTVLVRSGEYVIGEPITFRGKPILVKAHGGPEMTTIRMSDTPVDPERASVLIFQSGETSGSRLEGFKITGGAGAKYGMDWWQRGGGGVVCRDGSSPALTNCRISGNSAWGNGGGVVCGAGSSPILTSCTISGNVTLGADTGGGGVFCGASTTLINCTVSGNSAVRGGGVYCDLGSTPALTNCTISGNAAEWGSGVFCSPGSAPVLTNCILWDEDNPAESISQFPGQPVNPDVSYCVIQGDPLWPGAGNTNQDPLFVRPAEWEDCGADGQPDCMAYIWSPDTGDPTAWRRWVFDYRLQPGSPAIDAGAREGAPPTDFEGNVRPCGAGVDIGAYEYGDCWPSMRFHRGDADGNGRVQITDPVKVLRYLFLGEVSPTCLDAADADDSGTVLITDAVYSLAFLFTGGPPPAEPFSHCGMDPVIDTLDCQAYSACP